MSTSSYALKFTVASRTLFARKLQILHWDAFGKANSDNFQERLPAPPAEHSHGYLVHSVETRSQLSPISKNSGHILYVLDKFPRYVTRFDGTFEDFLNTKSSKTRSTLRRKVRNFAKADNRESVQWRQYQSAGEIAEFLDLALPLAARTYQAKLFDGALPGTSEFREEALSRAHEGRVLAYLLFLGGLPVAYLYTPVDDRVAVYAYLGFEDRLAHLSPGTVLQYLVHESLFQSKVADYFDFTEGDGAHKALFASDSTACSNILVVRDTAANQSLIYLHRGWGKAIEATKTLAEKLNMKTRLKKLAR